MICKMNNNIEILLYVWEIDQEIKILSYTPLANYQEFQIIGEKIRYLENIKWGLKKIN
jgi:hypothetical protein